MIRHILFWKLQEEYREGEKRREAEARLAASVETLAPIPGLHNAKIGPNLAGGEYDLVFYADLDDRDALATIRFTSRTASAARRSSPDASPEILRSEQPAHIKQRLLRKSTSPQASILKNIQ